MTTRFGVQATVAIGGVSYRVLRHELREEISEVSSLRCAFVNDHGEPPDASSLLDKPAVLTLTTFDGNGKRSFVGLVVRAENDEDVVEVDVAPKAWRMSRRADCRIFQTLSVVDIVTQVLSDAGVDTTEWKTTGTYAPREYTVQYRETDLDFIRRLLSEEGIYYAIRHDDTTDTVVFGDDPTGLDAVQGPTSLTFRADRLELGTENAFVMDVTRTCQVRSDKTTLRDYDSDKPKLKLESTAKDEKASAEVYVWPGRFKLPKIGDQLATVLLDSIRADRDVVTGRTTVLTLVPGARFSIEGHPYASLNQEYLVVSVVFEGDHTPINEQSGREAGGDEAGRGACTFRAIPTKVNFRPPRVLRERWISGAQTAITTGAPSEEIHTDAGGHVKVQFYWDRLGKNDDKSSGWMRTSQLPTGGSMLLPRMNWEVAVRYLDGDIDHPMVMARMYNAASPPPYALPAHKGKSSIQTATSPGGGSTNEIRMSDDAGSEEMFMNASKDMSVDVGNNTTESIGVNLTRQVGSNHNLNITNSLTASVGASQTVNVAAQQSVHVQTFMVDQIGGNQTVAIGAARSMKVGGDHKREIGGDSTVKVGSMMIDLVVGSANEHALGNHKHDVGAALVEMTAGGRSLIVGGNRAEVATLAKVIVTGAGRSVDVTGTMSSKVGGIIYRKIAGDLAETAASNITEVATGAQILKATNIAIEGQSMLTIVMGASTIVMTPSTVTIAGLSMKVDGEIIDEGALVLDN
jgi:type VI secretion system secreted protein VgrG